MIDAGPERADLPREPRQRKAAPPHVLPEGEHDCRREIGRVSGRYQSGSAWCPSVFQTSAARMKIPPGQQQRGEVPLHAHAPRRQRSEQRPHPGPLDARGDHRCGHGPETSEADQRHEPLRRSVDQARVGQERRKLQPPRDGEGQDEVEEGHRRWPTTRGGRKFRLAPGTRLVYPTTPSPTSSSATCAACVPIHIVVRSLPASAR